MFQFMIRIISIKASSQTNNDVFTGFDICCSYTFHKRNNKIGVAIFNKQLYLGLKKSNL